MAVTSRDVVRNKCKKMSPKATARPLVLGDVKAARGAQSRTVRGAQRGQSNSLGVHSSCNCVTTLSGFALEKNLVRVPNPGALAPYTTAELQPQIPLVPRAATGRGVGSNPQSPAQQGLVRGIGGLSLVRSSALRAMAAHHNMRTSSTAAFVQEFL